MHRPLQLALFFSLNAAVAVQAEDIRFNRDIRPILSENCFSCHGADEKARKAKLRLDVSEEATREHKNGSPIVPGDLNKSVVWERILSTDEDDENFMWGRRMMPLHFDVYDVQISSFFATAHRCDGSGVR